MGSLAAAVMGRGGEAKMPGERGWPQILEWNATTVPFPDQACLHDLVRAQALRSPDALAVVADDGRVSYSELEDRAGRLAGYLSHLGVGPEVCVGVCLNRSVDLLVALLGILKAGGAYLPIEPHLPRERMAQMLSDARPPVLITSSSLRERLPDYGGIAVLMDSHRKLWIAAEPLVRGAGSAHNLAYILYTSGSTGTPKGVMVEHRSIVNQLTWRAGWLRLQAGDRVLQKAPLGFDVSVWEIFCPLICGAAVVMLKAGGQSDPSAIGTALRDESVTAVSFAPSMLRVFLDEGGAKYCQSLRVVNVGGETLSPALATDFFRRIGERVLLANLYGPTETTVISTYWVCHPGEDPIPIGRPIANTQVYVLDSELRPLPVGEAGDLFIGGVGVARGYLKRPELTAERFLPNPFLAGDRIYRSGDRAKWRPDGALLYLGRLDDQVKVRGSRVELGEVEAALLRHPRLAQASVVVRPDPRGDPALVAYVAPKGIPGVVTGAQLRAFLRRSLPNYMIPSSFVVTDQLPLMANGKVDRSALPAEVVEVRTPVALQGDREMRLGSLFAELLGLNPDQVGAEDDFFDLGGHSLLAVRLLGEIAANLGVELPISVLYDGPATVARIVAAIESLDAALPAPPSALVSSGSDVVFFVASDEATLVSLRHVSQALAPEYRVVGLLPETLDGHFDLSLRIEDLAAALIVQMRHTQPHGPYAVAGFSIGGLIAYEIAGQLVGEGEAVAWLGVVDATRCAPLAQRRLWGTSRWLVVRHLREIGPHRVLLGGLGALRDTVAARLRPSGEPEAQVDNFDYPGALTLALQYQPMGHQIPMDLFSSEVERRATGSETLGWEAVHRGPITPHPMPGSHHAMMALPAIAAIAAVARASLEQVGALQATARAGQAAGGGG